MQIMHHIVSYHMLGTLLINLRSRANE